MKSIKINYKYRIGKNIGFQALITVLACGCVVPLIFILVYILKAGITKINWHFLTNLPKPVGESGGGIANALVGSMIIIAIASVIAIPLAYCVAYILVKTKKASWLTGAGCV